MEGYNAVGPSSVRENGKNSHAPSDEWYGPSQKGKKLFLGYQGLVKQPQRGIIVVDFKEP